MLVASFVRRSNGISIDFGKLISDRSFLILKNLAFFARSADGDEITERTKSIDHYTWSEIVYASKYSVLCAAQGDIISIMRCPRLYCKPANYGLRLFLVPLSGPFLDFLHTKRLDNLLRVSEFVSNSYADRTKMALGRSIFVISWDQMYKGLEKSNDASVIHECTTGRVHSSDAFEAGYPNGAYMYYCSFLASLYDYISLYTEYTERSRLCADWTVSYKRVS